MMLVQRMHVEMDEDEDDDEDFIISLEEIGVVPAHLQEMPVTRQHVRRGRKDSASARQRSQA